MPDADRTHTTGYWRNEGSLPIGGARVTRYLLAEGGRLAETTAAETGTEYDEYDYRPTVGGEGGLWSGGVPFGLPTDQRADEAYSLSYTSAPLDEPMEIIGRPRATQHASSTASVMGFVAKLSDVAPDGGSALVAVGALNGTRRDSLTDPRPMQPSEVYELDVELDATAWRFDTWHRLRLSICSADFPNLWPTPYNGTKRVYRDPEHPSRLDLRGPDSGCRRRWHAARRDAFRPRQAAARAV